MTTPRNIKVSAINDLRAYAIHRKHMEKSEMSEIKKFRMRRTVEAVQWTGRNLAEVESLLNLFVEESPNGFLYIITDEGIASARRGDWIVKGIRGNIIVCEPDDFVEIYEPANAGRDPESEDDHE